MKLRLSSLDPPRTTPAAACFGPVVLGFEAPSARTLQALNVSSLDHLLTPEPGHPLRFSLASDGKVRARPFASFREGEHYFVYLDPKMGMRISYRDVKFTGQWHDAGAFRFSNEIGATAACEFYGKGVRWLGRRFNDAGNAEIMIDGQVVATVDQYGPGRDLPFDWSHSGLAPGSHTIQLRLLSDKPAASTDRFLNVIGFEALDN